MEQDGCLVKTVMKKQDDERKMPFALSSLKAFTLMTLLSHERTDALEKRQLGTEAQACSHVDDDDDDE